MNLLSTLFRLAMLAMAPALLAVGCAAPRQLESQVLESCLSPAVDENDDAETSTVSPQTQNDVAPTDSSDDLETETFRIRPAVLPASHLTRAQDDLPPDPQPVATIEGEFDVSETAEPIPPGSALADDSEPRATPLDFGTALALTQGQNPRIAFTQAQIAQAFAQYEAARILWLPNIRAGMNYNKHEGRIQDVEGNNIEVSRSAAYAGMGAGAVGAGSPSVPGLSMQFHLSDALYQKQIRGSALSARQFESDAAVNDQLLETSLAYLALLSAHQQQAIAGQTLQHGEELAKLTAEFARTGEGTLADADRAEAAVSLQRNDLVRAEEAIAVASARLAQQMSADPATMIVPAEPTIVPIDMVSLESPLCELVATGLTNRPELGASRSLVGEAAGRLRREAHAPWLPSVVLGVSYGSFGAGVGSDITNSDDRFDLDAVAWWEIRNLGFGEAAARDNARAQIEAAQMREVETMDLVAREVVEAHAQAVARKRQIAVAQAGIRAAEQSYERNLNRIKNGEGLPIEVLQSIQALDAAQRDYLRATIDYNSAQFRLQRALGWPIAQLRSSGE